MGLKVLLIEDDPTLLRAISRTLGACGYDVSTAMSVAEAHQAIARSRPTLIVLDIDLPDGSGWEVLRSLRQDGGHDVATVVMSALRPNPRLAEELGVMGVLEKPFPIESLIRLVARGCGVADPAEPAVLDMDG